jgi:hypothetical protein
MTRTPCWSVMLVAAGLLVGGRGAGAQTASPGSVQAVPAQNASEAPKSATPVASQIGSEPAKQTQLALQAQKLVAMATELKASVDKTNKDVLSCAVLREAQDIEQYAHQMKKNEVK